MKENKASSRQSSGVAAPTREEIQAMTVVKLREICTINNLGGEKDLKKDLVHKVSEFYNSL